MLSEGWLSLVVNSEVLCLAKDSHQRQGWASSTLVLPPGHPCQPARSVHRALEGGPHYKGFL